jgi:hypothetical protein
MQSLPQEPQFSVGRLETQAPPQHIRSSPQDRLSRFASATHWLFEQIWQIGHVIRIHVPSSHVSQAPHLDPPQ